FPSPLESRTSRCLRELTLAGSVTLPEAQVFAHCSNSSRKRYWGVELLFWTVERRFLNSSREEAHKKQRAIITSQPPALAIPSASE
ncbi:MAG: hypothetical protein ABSD20_12700, partial [Terriglobales bacterium]